CLGPCTADELAARLGLALPTVDAALARLEAEGFVLRGHFDPVRSVTASGASVEFCERRLLARIHRYTTTELRREIEPVTAQDFLRFLLRWQHVTAEGRREGRRGLLAVIEQLQGFEVAAGSWEESVFPARVAAYRPEWLDELCLSGEVVWARLAPRGAQAMGTTQTPAEVPGRGGLGPSRATAAAAPRGAGRFSRRLPRRTRSTPRAWPRAWPSSSWRAGACCSATWWPGRPWRCPGGRSSGHSGASRPAAPSAAAASSPAS